MVTTEIFTAPNPPHHPALLSKADQPGRIRGTALEIYDAVRQSPAQADTILSRSLRQAKHLHSRERRFVAHSLYALIRYHNLLAHVIESEDTMDLWHGWLQWQGLPSETPPPLLDTVEQLLSAQDPLSALNIIGGFHPDISQALLESLGDRVWDFLWASNRRGPLTLRTNPSKATRDTVQTALKTQNIDTTPLDSTPHGLTVTGTANIHGQRCYQDGWFEIQDEGSQLLANLCGTVSGTVIDYCAGAGGKTLAIAASSPDCSIIACDVRHSALSQLEKRAKRAGTSRVRTHNLATPLQDTADTVFVDAPCSGLGTLRRHPELRLRLNGNALKTVAALQLEILHLASERVNPGGRLIYGTCSVLNQENEEAIDSFLANHPHFEKRGPSLVTAPHIDNTDGFYGQVLHRV